MSRRHSKKYNLACNRSCHLTISRPKIAKYKCPKATVGLKLGEVTGLDVGYLKKNSRKLFSVRNNLTYAGRVKEELVAI